MMKLKILLYLIYTYVIIHSTTGADKWSRQVESSGAQPETYDWVPVAQSADAKDRAGRVITYQQSFPSNGAFGEFQKNHHALSSQAAQPFGFPFHFQRFPQTQAQPLISQPLQGQQQLHQQPSVQQQKVNIQPQQPTSQSFFKFEMPYNRDGNRNQDNIQGVQTGYQIQHSSFGGLQPLFHSTLFNQKQVFPPEFHPAHRPQQNLLQQQSKPIQQNFLNDQTKQPLRESNAIPTQANLVSTVAPPQPFPLQQAFVDTQKPASFQSQQPYQVSQSSAPVSATGSQLDQEVQLLYVPYETLYNQQRNENPLNDHSKFNSVSNAQHVSPYQINNFYNSDVSQPQDHSIFTTSTTSRPTTSLRPSPTYQNYFDQQFSTAKTTKLKAHQPPLAMFLLKSTQYPTQIDVINSLKDSKTIAVLDAPTAQTPNIFVGPANMQVPIGYVKFDLPYLSQLTQNGNIADIPFFVAPLSYRTPAGFNKILLPEPHVGSIVVNIQKATQNGDFNKIQIVSPIHNDGYNNVKYSNPPSLLPENNLYNNIRDANPIPPQTSHSSLHHTQTGHISNTKTSEKITKNQNSFTASSQNDLKQFSTTTPRTRPESTQRTKTTVQSEFQSNKFEGGRFPYEVTTQKQQPTHNRGHKYSEISTHNNFNSEAIQEVTSPKIYKKRPDSHYPDNIKPHSQFKPIPNNIAANDFYKVQPVRTHSQSTSTTTTPVETTPSAPPRTFFTKTYPTRPQIDIQSTRGQLYHGNENFGNGLTTRPSLQQQKIESPISNEEYRMKQYFRQQEAFRNRSPFTTSTVKPNIESVPYTPVSVDYDHEVRIPSSTPTYYTSTTPKSATLRQRITFYHPTPTTSLHEESSNTVIPSNQVFEFSRDHNALSTPPQQEVITEQPKNSFIPDLAQNKSQNENFVQDTSELEYEPNPYQLPSELPPLTPNLPGLVNGLIEKDKLNGVEAETTTQIETTTKPTLPVKPTRRPINRTRKPVVSKVSQSVSYSSSDFSTRRPINRIRRPYNGRHNTTTATSTTEKSSNARSPVIRNPNRIRYNPTPEERESLRLKTRKHPGNGKKEDKNDDLEYQRDVLKQNYPVFRPANKKTTTPTPASTEKPTSETQQIYTVTPSTEQQFSGLVEPMQIAQQYQEYPQNNYGPGYFPNEEELQPTEAVFRNEIHSIYSTSSSTELPKQSTTRRMPFIRRGLRIKTTTESALTTTTPVTATGEEEAQSKIKTPARRIVKVRARTRRPHPASLPSTTEDFNEATPLPEKNNYSRLNRFNQDLYQDELAQRRQRIKSQFHLETQESQWSPSLSGKSTDGFQPLAQKDEQNTTTKFTSEPEIVTASPETDKAESFTFNVSASLEPQVDADTNSKNIGTTTSEALPKKSDKSFADLLEEVMSDIGREPDFKSNKGSYFESQKTDTRSNRRNKWKNSVAGESFETAESQNIGTQFFNSLYTGTIEKATESLASLEDIYATTAFNESVSSSTISTDSVETDDNLDESIVVSTPGSDITTQSTDESYSSNSFENTHPDSQPESITRRMDDLWNVEDLDSQPSMFSEVRKQLNELFTIEKSDKNNDEYTNDVILPHKPEYTNIQRVRNSAESTMPNISTRAQVAQDNKEANTFHKSLMESVVYATSTSTKEQTSETEICYRGHCIRSEDLPPNHKLH